MNTTFFVLIGTSRNAYGGPRWTLDAMVTEADIIKYAEQELECSGRSLAGWAGIEEFWDENGYFQGFSRPWEELETALAVLNDDGQTYAIWPDDVRDNVVDFLDEAGRVGLGDAALELIEKYSHIE